MKRRTKELAAFGLAAMMLFAGCGTKDTAGTTPQAENPVQTTTNEIENQAEAEPETEIETEETETVTFTYIGSEYDNLYALNDSYYLYETEGKKGVMDSEGNVLTDAYVDYSLANQGDGCFALGVDNGDGTYDYKLYDKDFNEIWSNANYPNYYVDSYNEGVLILAHNEKTENILIDGYQGFVESATLNDEIYSGYQGCSPFANGKTMIYSFCLADIEGREDLLINYVDREGNAGSVRPYFTTNPCAMDADGWVAGFPHNSDWSYDGEWVLYNTLTEQEVDIARAGTNRMTYDKAGTVKFVQRDGYTCLMEDDEAKTWKILSLETGNYVREDEYGYVGLDYLHEGMVMVSLPDDAGYMYLDANNNFADASEVYEDASDFNNGYAMIHKDGGEYLIDTNFEIISEQIAGDGASNFAPNVFELTLSSGKHQLVRVDVQ